MKIIRARIRGLGDTIESEWFELSPRLNLFHLPEEKGRTSFLRTLATINPLFPCEETRPFADFPLISRQRGYSRRIIPKKRTVALAIFSTSPDLVAELAAASPHLYEADRVEIGRRLDYSRWINFVEIASSTRWSEIAAELKQLAEQMRRNAPEKVERLELLTQALQGSDRIKSGIAQGLHDWLQSLPAGIREGEPQRIDRLIRAIHRASDFHRARGIIEQRLPIFVTLSASAPPCSTLSFLLERINGRIKEPETSMPASQDFFGELNRHLAAIPPTLKLRLDISDTGAAFLSSPPLAPADPNSALPALQAAVALAIAFSRASCRTDPILLFDCPEKHLPGPLHRQLAEFILTVAEFCQCCHTSANGNIFSRQKNLPRYTVADLTGRGH